MKRPKIAYKDRHEYAQTYNKIGEWFAKHCPGAAWWRELDEEGNELLDVFTVFVLSLRK